MVRRFEPGPQPGGRAPAPGELGLVQAFVNTFWRPGAGTEMLARPADLRAWLWESGLPGAEAPVSAAQLDRALDLREGLRGLLYVNNGASADPARQARLDAALDGLSVGIRLTGSGPELAPAGGGVDGALGSLATAVARAMLEGRFARLKACPGRTAGGRSTTTRATAAAAGAR
jgi:hypothetical protein